MNAAERLWRALAGEDWAAVRAQFHRSAMIERVGSGSSSVDEYVAAHRVEAAQARPVEILRTLTDGGVVVVEARVGARRCAGIYDLHDGRIAGATEYWA
jgi:hypothetical protein